MAEQEHRCDRNRQFLMRTCRPGTQIRSSFQQNPVAFAELSNLIGMFLSGRKADDIDRIEFIMGMIVRLTVGFPGQDADLAVQAMDGDLAE